MQKTELVALLKERLVAVLDLTPEEARNLTVNTKPSELGCDSLDAVDLMLDVEGCLAKRQLLHEELPEEIFIGDPTIGEFADKLLTRLCLATPA